MKLGHFPISLATAFFMVIGGAVGFNFEGFKGLLVGALVGFFIAILLSIILKASKWIIIIFTVALLAAAFYLRYYFFSTP